MEKFTKKQPIESLKDGDVVEDIFVVKIKKGVSEYSKGYSFNLLLSDSSGKTIDYKYWGGTVESKVRALYDAVKQDSVVYVQGKVSSYKEKLQITTNEPSVIRALEVGQYDEREFIKKAKRDTEQMYGELKAVVQTIKNEKLKKLLELIFFDEDVKEKFAVHPGAIEIHHNWIGGLLQHTLEVVKYCELSAKLYPNLDRDLLLTGAMLHDIGKLEEIEMTSRIKGTRVGQLTGHLALGFAFLSKKIEEAGIKGHLKDKLLHLMVSHHGKNEFGSFKEAMVPEAAALYHADETSSKIAEMIEFVEDSKDLTEDEFMYHKRKGHNIFLR